jgi:UDP-glucose 4-epimerase
MKKIAIVGSDSFIAMHFYNEIAEKQNIKLFSRISSLKQNEIVKDLFQISSSDLDGIEVVLNFAAIVHQPKIADEHLYKKVNTELPIHLANEAIKAGVKHYIQMSTIAVYGDVSKININTPENPLNLYGISKLNADNELIKMQNENFKVTIIRPPMVYGGGLAPGNMQKLIRFAQKGIPLPFKGINNLRDFIHVRNLVQALNCVTENNLVGVIIPTDQDPVSTSKILTVAKTYSSSKIRQIAIPKFMLALLRIVLKRIYNKLYGNLLVECNLSQEIYLPKYTIEDGIREMVKAIELK